VRRAAFVLLLLAVAAAPAASAAGGPSPSACAAAWNQSAPQRLRTLVAKSDARAAFIDAQASVGTDTWSKSGGSSSTSSSGCSIQFVLPGGAAALLAWGPWHAGTIRAWQSPIRSVRSFPVPHNARVRRDGSVGFTG
jgi:hypothetical protein